MPRPMLISHNGIEDSVSGHAERAGISRKTAFHRLRAGWTIQDTFETDPERIAAILRRIRCENARKIEDARRRRGTHRNGATGPVQPTHRFAWEAEREPIPQPPGVRLPGMPTSLDRIEELTRRAEAGEELFGEADRAEAQPWGTWE